MVAAFDDGREWLLEDPFDGGRWFGLGVGRNGGRMCPGVGWMGVATEVVVVGGWDCFVVVVELLIETDASA